MKRRLIAVLLTVALLASVAICAGAMLFTDTNGHWAEDYIDDAALRGLFSGVEDGTRFDPDSEMTRAMFVTVLGRVAGIEEGDYDTEFLTAYFDDVKVDAYYAPYVAWAVTVGVTSGVSDRAFAPDAPVSREQMARFIHNYLFVAGILQQEAPQQSDTPALPEGMARGEFDPQQTRTPHRGSDVILPPDEFDDDDPPAEITFSDVSAIASWAKDSVELLKDSGLFTGAPDGKGGYMFMPKKTATRAECAVVFCKLQDLLQQTPANNAPQPTNVVLNQDSAVLEAGSDMQLASILFPVNEEVDPRVNWYTTDPSVARVDCFGNVTGIAAGEAEIRVRTASGLEAACSFTVTAPPRPAVYAPNSWYDKCEMIFGRVLSDPRLAYADDAEARQHMTTVSIQVWDINEAGEKYTRTFYLQVHENIADIVVRMFEEIYELPEQVPIHSLGCYRWDGKCEHSVGLAIDINPMENYYCTKDGKAVVGKYFKPGEDPYSIPVGEKVDQIFAKYGFTRGIYWNNGYQDYMHYSYFGT